MSCLALNYVLLRLLESTSYALIACPGAVCHCRAVALVDSPQQLGMSHQSLPQSRACQGRDLGRRLPACRVLPQGWAEKPMTNPGMCPRALTAPFEDVPSSA